MATKPRQFATLVLLLVLLAVLVVAQKDRLPWASAGAQTTAARATSPRAPAETPPQGPGDEVATVKLGDLQLTRPAPHAGDRNPFRFASRPIVTTPGSGGNPNRVSAGRLAVPSEPSGPPPTPPIPLKFIGLVDAPGQTTRIAVLSDGRNVFHGREGDIIDGRYRILHIGAESIEMVYVDGRGRQVIRLSGGGA